MEKKEKKYIYISKLDAAKRQLEISIRLFFRYSDVVAIHALVAAAHDILRNLGKKQGVKSIKDEMLDRIKENKRKEYGDMVNEAQNFFKHANRDEDKLLKFHPVQTEFLLHDACVLYNEIVKEKVPIIEMYCKWFYIKRPNIIADPKVEQVFQKVGQSFDINDRAQFIKESLFLIEEDL